MTLTDTGPLVALIDKDDSYHLPCVSLLATLPAPLVTPWPCFGEAMHLLHRAGGFNAQAKLWEYVTLGALVVRQNNEAEQVRMKELMSKYQDRPMDLADAALVAAAEVLEVTRVFSIDSDFYVYRLADGSALEVVPGPAAGRIRGRG